MPEVRWPDGVDPAVVAECNCAGCQALVGALIATWGASRRAERHGLGQFVDAPEVSA